MTGRLFTSESVTEGHPDKIADQISDSVLDALLAQDPRSRVAVETLITTGQVHLAGEVTTNGYADIPAIVRETVLGIGYDSSDKGFDGASCGVSVSIGAQSPDIAQGVDKAYEVRVEGEDDELERQGAGDQGMMFGYACDETPELMPLPIALAHRIARRLSVVRKDGTLPYLRPDGKTQVTIEYAGDRPVRLDTVVVSVQHADEVELEMLKPDVQRHVLDQELAGLGIETSGYRLLVNPTGRFVIGGPMGDAGLTGRKIIVDTYGGMARHGGGAFSGKDPSKVDRSGAYAMRWVAKNVVAAGLARRCEVQVAYAIGKAEPVGLFVECFGTEAVELGKIQVAIESIFDLRPAAIIRDLDLLRPIYARTAAYGHFGRPEADFPWESTDQAEPLAKEAGLLTDPAAPALPVARVAVDTSLPHLDRPFDYLVPAGLDAAASAGSRVRVRFAGRLVDGYVLERRAESDHGARLAPLVRSVSAEPVLSTEVAGLCRAVADRYAGTLADVLRLAVPPRHGGSEAQPSPPPAPLPAAPAEPGTWARYDAGPALLTALARGGSPRAVWEALPGPHWPGELAAAVQATLAAGRGAVVVVPDARDLAWVDAALTGALGPGRHVALSADLGPAERYRRWLAVRRGAVRCVVGTRAAAFAPVSDLGLVVVWDDGDDLHKEPRSPYPHVRDVLALRAHRTGAAALVGGFTPSVEAYSLLQSGWARRLAAPRAVLRRTAPRAQVAGADREQERDAAAASARLPTLAWRTAREALAADAPVLVQVPRTGYRPALACSSCRTPTRCAACAGPLRQPAGSAPACRWCGRPATGWRCPVCRSGGLRAVVIGSRRTAEELGRSMPGVPVRTSDRQRVLAGVGREAALVVATPGAEPVADGGYGAVLLLDGGALLARPDLRAGEEALRRWCAAAALARPADEGGTVVLMAEAGLPAVQAMVRWDPAGHAARESRERSSLGFPPAVRIAALDGPPEPLADLLAAVSLPAGAEVLGPVPFGDGERALVRVSPAAGADLARSLAAGLAVRSARKAAGAVRVELDPLTLV